MLGRYLPTYLIRYTLCLPHHAPVKVTGQVRSIPANVHSHFHPPRPSHSPRPPTPPRKHLESREGPIR
ncbi:hypothetical protein Cob_v006814 [Colletotrichum orbiculare MAFF 240422]|uniref:Uncharacterized protein n=1 Tax=Colletotrichum orbiculare (strain 104-T / ATCC 96160 / CBS 514.97 / LARS 414 / MAFF 240422) TaxID=1213857 RepID=A0A484FQV6_COLOR|nr:hypothetical protein Cob_v006814 [Colletotrichum orbiculare MAFF 240422]